MTIRTNYVCGRCGVRLDSGVWCARCLMLRESVPMLWTTASGTIQIIPDEEHPRGWFTLKQGRRIEMHPIDYRALIDEMDKRGDVIKS